MNLHAGALWLQVLPHASPGIDGLPDQEYHRAWLCPFLLDCGEVTLC